MCKPKWCPYFCSFGVLGTVIFEGSLFRWFYRETKRTTHHFVGPLKTRRSQIESTRPPLKPPFFSPGWAARSSAQDSSCNSVSSLDSGREITRTRSSPHLRRSSWVDETRDSRDRRRGAIERGRWMSRKSKISCEFVNPGWKWGTHSRKKPRGNPTKSHIH